MSGLPIQSSQNAPIIDWTANQIGDPVIYGLFPLLTHDFLADGISLVCKQWKEWADKAPVWTARHLSQLNVRIFSRQAIEEELKRLLPPAMFAELSFDMIPHEIDFRLTLIKAARFIARIKAAGTAVEGDEGLTIMPRPEGLTLHMLHAAYPTRFQYISEEILGKFRDKKSEGGQFMITSNILEKTRRESVEEQQSLCKKAGGDLPEFLNAVFYALMAEEIYAIRPLGDSPWTYTRCLERIDGRPLIVGGFAPGGLSVNVNVRFAYDFYGAGVLRKF